jgi:hypothetical protein
VSAKLPQQIQTPAGEQMVLQLHAVGVQIYVCQENSEGKPAWVVKAPEAELYDREGYSVGKHYAGPTWKHADGSEVSARLVARVDSPEPQAIPWLLLAATRNSGDGVFNGVTSIQRINTQGGQAPSTCQSSDLNAEIKVEPIS